MLYAPFSQDGNVSRRLLFAQPLRQFYSVVLLANILFWPSDIVLKDVFPIYLLVLLWFTFVELQLGYRGSLERDAFYHHFSVLILIFFGVWHWKKHKQQQQQSGFPTVKIKVNKSLVIRLAVLPSFCWFRIGFFSLFYWL